MCLAVSLLNSCDNEQKQNDCELHGFFLFTVILTKLSSILCDAEIIFVLQIKYIQIKRRAYSIVHTLCVYVHKRKQY